MARRRKARKGCRWYGGMTASGAQAKKLCYKPTNRRHPKGWKYANGPYRTKWQALHSHTSPTYIGGRQRRPDTRSEPGTIWTHVMRSG